MNEAEIKEAESAATDEITAGSAAISGWAQSLWSRVDSNLKKSGAKLQDSASVSADSPAQLEPAVTERAEAALDRAGERLGIFAASLSHQVRRSAALVREEAEDILAEAQSFRQKDQV